MDIQYDWENWQKPAMGKRIWRMLIGALALCAFWLVTATAVIATLLILIEFVTSVGSSSVRTVAAYVVLFFVAASVVILFKPYRLLMEVTFSLWLWARCRMAVGVVDDDLYGDPHFP